MDFKKFVCEKLPFVQLYSWKPLKWNLGLTNLQEEETLLYINTYFGFLDTHTHLKQESS